MSEGKTRAEALALLHEFTLTDALRKHGVAVETAMKAYAHRRGNRAAGDAHSIILTTTRGTPSLLTVKTAVPLKLLSQPNRVGART